MENQLFQWLVKRGRISIIEEFPYINLSIDTEGAESCLLTKQDSIDIMHILSNLAQNIWENLDQETKKQSSKSNMINESEHLYQWKIDSDVLTLSFNKVEDCMELKVDKSNEVKLPITPTVELVQVLGFYVSN